MKDVTSGYHPAQEFFAQQCAGCKLCYAECSVLDGLGMSPVQLANMLRSNQDIPAQIISLIQQWFIVRFMQ